MQKVHSCTPWSNDHRVAHATLTMPLLDWRHSLPVRAAQRSPSGPRMPPRAQRLLPQSQLRSTRTRAESGDFASAECTADSLSLRLRWSPRRACARARLQTPRALATRSALSSTALATFHAPLCTRCSLQWNGNKVKKQKLIFSELGFNPNFNRFNSGLSWGKYCVHTV